MREFRVPAVGLGLVREAKPAWVRSFGLRDVVKREPVNSDTVFEAASLGKPVFALGVLKLVEEGKLDLDRPLVDYMPEPFVSTGDPWMSAGPIPNDPRLRKITPRLVLRHATGLPNWGEGRPLRFLSDPGESYTYSGEAFHFLQRVVEHVAQQDAEVFLRRAVLSPLGMERSSFVWQRDYESVAAIRHDREEKPFSNARPTRASVPGTLHTTASEYARFLAAMMDAQPAAALGVSPALRAEMIRPATRVNDEISWGLGWGLQTTADGPAFWHWGNNPGAKSFAIGYGQQGIGVVVLTNSDNGLRAIARIIPAAIGGGAPAYFRT